MILEGVMLYIKTGQGAEFEAAFRRAAPFISASKGHIRHELHKCMEAADKYLLLVWWETLEDHTQGFRGSAAYQDWKRLLHHFYEPFPTVEHFTLLDV